MSLTGREYDNLRNALRQSQAWYAAERRVTFELRAHLRMVAHAGELDVAHAWARRGLELTDRRKAPGRKRFRP